MAAPSIYDPDAGVVEATRFSAVLSQRDVSIQVPVNYVSHPGVVLAAACFGNGTYEDAPTAKCVSNLLASGFRRLVADVYWDASRGHWQLCPVELDVAEEPLTSSITVASIAASTSSNAMTAGQKRQNDDQLSAVTPSSTESISTIASASRTLTPSASATNTAMTDTETSSGDTSVLRVGPYYCSPTTDFDLLMDVVEGYLQATATTLNATMLILSLHVHAAAPATAPLGSSLQPADDRLPDSGSLLSARIETNNSAYLYTPTDLLSQRQNLNSTDNWFGVPAGERPVSSYFQVDTTGSTTSTPDGWPSESFVEMSVRRRLMVQFGDVDPQMASYDFDGDASTIFPSNYLTETPTVDASSNGTITSGCLFDPSITMLSAENSSWALNSIGSGSSSSLIDLLSRLALASNLTSCGFSPILNETLNSTSADLGYAAYQSFASSATIWSWASGQPVNASKSASLNDHRCAALDAMSGRWYASDCGDSHYGACRVNSQPYSWRISSDSVPYERVGLGCDDDVSDFDVPRTALEHAHLLSVWQRHLAGSNRRRDDDDNRESLLFLDFNQLDVSGCWVKGINTTCPYSSSMDDETKRIAVPVIGAVIVLGLSLLTILVKCAGNRQTAKRRKRRRNEGWDYEGVPS